MRHIQGARDLPWARRGLVSASTREKADAAIAAAPPALAAHAQQSVEHIRSGLASAELYWVTSSMTELALDAALDIPNWTMVSARPSPSGLLIWGGVLPEVPVLALDPAQHGRG